MTASPLKYIFDGIDQFQGKQPPCQVQHFLISDFRLALENRVGLFGGVGNVGKVVPQFLRLFFNVGLHKYL
jgi:hypothetical protein